MDIDLNVLLQIVAVEIEHEVVDEVEAVADDDERELVGELGLLQEVLDAIGVVAVALAADTLHLLDLSSLACRLNDSKENEDFDSSPVLISNLSFLFSSIFAE